MHAFWKSTTLAFSLAACFHLVAANGPGDFIPPFYIQNITTHQPTGNPDGQVNYYRIDFYANNTYGSDVTAHCSTFWGDNSCTTGTGPGCAPYSVNVPTGDWIACDAAGISFQLYPYFSIGNFSIALQQVGSVATLQTDPLQITNDTSAFACTINPYQGAPSTNGVHASGDCSSATGSAPLSLNPLYIDFTCPVATEVNVAFSVQETTLWGDHIFVTGNITELGNWNPYNATALNADQYTAANQLWYGGNITLPANTAFEYKYIQWGRDGVLLWECDENRLWITPGDSCGYSVTGEDYFRCGRH